MWLTCSHASPTSYLTCSALTYDDMQPRLKECYYSGFFLKDTVKAFDNFKNKQKVYKVKFFDMQKYAYSVFLIHHTSR